MVGENEGLPIHISTDPMLTKNGHTNYALPLCKKGKPLGVGGEDCHYAGDGYDSEDTHNYNIVNLVDSKGWWKDFDGKWCKECYAMAEEESKRMRAMILLGGGDE